MGVAVRNGVMLRLNYTRTNTVSDRGKCKETNMVGHTTRAKQHPIRSHPVPRNSKCCLISLANETTANDSHAFSRILRTALCPRSFNSHHKNSRERTRFDGTWSNPIKDRIKDSILLNHSRHWQLPHSSRLRWQAISTLSSCLRYSFHWQLMRCCRVDGHIDGRLYVFFSDRVFINIPCSRLSGFERAIVLFQEWINLHWPMRVLLEWFICRIN